MRKETENCNFDRPCFVQTVYLLVRFSEVASEEWDKPAYNGVGLKCARLMSVYTVTRDRHTTDWRRARNQVKLSGRTFQCVYGTACRPATRRGERWA